MLSVGSDSNKNSDSISTIFSPDILGWFDYSPTGTTNIRFFINHLPLLNAKSIQIPMFPYENTYYMVLIEEGEEKSIFYKLILEPYIKNKFHDIYFFTNNLPSILQNSTEKSELTGKPCVFIVLISGNQSYQFPDIYLPKYPIFLFKSNLNLEEEKYSIDVLSKASGGKAFTQNDHKSLLELDALLHSYLKNQRIIFTFRLPFIRCFLPNKLEILSGRLIQEFQIEISKRYLKWIEILEKTILLFLTLTGLSICITLYSRSRKKWKKKKQIEARKKALKKFHIGWLEFISIQNPSVRITKSLFTIGSAPSCDLVLLDSSISSHHCQIVDTEKGFLLLDLKSRLGTQINAKPIQQELLNDKDEITIGTIILIFHKSALQYVSDEKVL